jgi:hypothetical protein
MEALKDAFEIVANIATALAFAIAAQQLWQIRHQNSLESHLNLIQSERDIWLAAMQFPDMSATVDSVWGASSPKLARQNAFIAILMDSCEQIYARKEARVISDADWNSMQNYMKRLMSAPEVQRSWQDISGDYSPAFVSYVEKAMANARLQA